MEVVEIWEISGLNEEQRHHIKEIIEDCTFPWALLLPMIKANRGENFIPVRSSDLSKWNRLYEAGEYHFVHNSGVYGHPITIGRRQVLGVFWTDGQIEIERTIHDESLIKEVFLAESAHSVDYFLPLSDQQKIAIARLFHGGQLDTHTWWEIYDYGEEYYSLIGESFMALFTLAYSSIVPWQDSFIHKATPDMIPDIYEILDVWPEIEAPNVSSPLEMPYLLSRLFSWFIDLIRRLFNG
jgi:hypothetical protein